ncbi:MAG: type II toxin-antitoxin system HicA family toxin [Chloroflexota bacterium]|nr:MAG: type II toxin-antitoxin system HicA family toxin [Chloroflexota bacterium]
MARLRLVLSRVLSGIADRNVRFADLCGLLLALGFAERVRGSHHIYTRSGVVVILNLQPRDDGMAKPY